jgi:hypothetical protein
LPFASLASSSSIKFLGSLNAKTFYFVSFWLTMFATIWTLALVAIGGYKGDVGCRPPFFPCMLTCRCCGDEACDLGAKHCTLSTLGFT